MEHQEPSNWHGHELIARLQWSQRILLAKDDYKRLVPNECGVYRLRLVNCRSELIPIARFAKVDAGGVLYIGGTTNGGSLFGRFNKNLTGHSDGMRGKIEKNGKEQDLVQLWRDIHIVCPKASLTFEYAILRDGTEATAMEYLLHADYEAEYGEIPESGHRTPWPIHNNMHPWRVGIRNGQIERCRCQD